MQKLGIVKFISIGFDKESSEIIDRLESRGYKVSSIVRALLKKHGNEYLTGE